MLRLAAPSAPTRYNIGGTLTLNEDTGPVVTNLAPVAITVLPQPNLQLDYFWQRDVIGDDPTTPDFVEPSQPFTLGVQVHNVGAGDANNLTIDSAQPKIVDNQKGLDIAFKIIGSQLGANPGSDSLNVDFGNVKVGTTTTADWQMTSTLQGKFIDYSASYTNVNPLGLNESSIITSVKIHELIHAGDVNGDGIADFLANDTPDLQSAPDELYLSDGSKAPVSVIQSSIASETDTSGQIVLTISAPDKAAAWNYFDVLVPADTTYTIASVTRADGSALLPGEYWFTDRTFTNKSTAPTYEERIHILDNAASTSYTVTFAKNPAPTVADISIGLTNDTGLTTIDKVTHDTTPVLERRGGKGETENGLLRWRELQDWIASHDVPAPDGFVA